MLTTSQTPEVSFCLCKTETGTCFETKTGVGATCSDFTPAPVPRWGICGKLHPLTPDCKTNNPAWLPSTLLHKPSRPLTKRTPPRTSYITLRSPAEHPHLRPEQIANIALLHLPDSLQPIGINFSFFQTLEGGFSSSLTRLTPIPAVRVLRTRGDLHYSTDRPPLLLSFRRSHDVGKKKIKGQVIGFFLHHL